MFSRKDIDVTDRLTLALIFDSFLDGKIPLFLRKKGETAGSANRRRTLILNFFAKQGRSFKKEFNERIHTEALKLNRELDEIKEFEKEISEEGLISFRLLSKSLKKLAIFLKKESKENRLTPDLKKLAELKGKIIEGVKVNIIPNLVDPHSPMAEEIEKGKIAFV